MNTAETLRNTTIDPIHPRIASLDGLRFIAAGTVLFSHGTFIFSCSSRIPALPRTMRHWSRSPISA